VQHTVESGERIDPVINIKREIDDESFNPNGGIGGMSTNMALSIKSMTNNTFTNNTDGLDCVVCGDRATGKKKKSSEILMVSFGSSL
jgi:hypothetical protein